MRNKITEGKTISYAHSGAITSGSPLVIGALFGVAIVDGAANEEIEYLTEGVVELTKTSAQAWTVGQRLYWDAGNSEVTSVGTAGRFVGVAYKAAANPSSKGQVLLLQAPEFAEGQQAAVANVATADADATYGQPEADLINELKAQLNALLAALRAGGHIAT